MLQYSLRTLLLAMLFVALATWVSFVLPDPLGVLVLGAVLATIPGIVAAGIVYCRGYWQAFCIGAAPVQAMNLLAAPFWLIPYPFSQFPLSYPGNTETFLYVKATMVGALFVTAVAGAGAMLIRYLALPKVAPPAEPTSRIGE